MENNTLFRKIFLAGSFLVLALPLLNFPPLFSPPDWGKAIVFRILLSALLLLFVWNIKRVHFPSLKKRESLGLALLLLLAGLFFLATLFSFDPNFSLWGTPSRGGGFVNFALLIAFAIGTFLIFRPKDWKKVWDVAIFAGGVPVAILAVFQVLGWFSNILITRMARPMSTLGNDIQLGMYLILLLFPLIAFFLQTKKILKKTLYAVSFLLFLIVIILTGSRGAYLGIAAGFSYLILFFPFKKLSYSLISKFAFLLVMLVPFLFVYYVNTHAEPQFSQKNPALHAITGRLQLFQFVRQEPRFSTWKVGWNAIMARPLLGYGPENFEVAFDRFYDPSYPNIQYLPNSSNSWWDRAHNFFVDNASQTGIPAVLVYVSIFGVLIWQLQKLKKQGSPSSLTAHALQTTFIAYLVADFFAFDSFSTYLLSFFAVAFALSLAQKERQNLAQISGDFKGRYIIVGLLAAFLLWFNWQFNIQPLRANAKVNYGVALMQQKNCAPAISRMEQALTTGSTFLDAYANARYFDVLRGCQAQISNQDALLLTEKEYALMSKAAALWPYHTRNWIFLAQLTSLLAEQEAKAKTIAQSQYEKLIEESNSYFAKSAQLSPKHQEIYIEWTKAHIASKNYEEALQTAEQCATANPQLSDCWLLKAVVFAYMGNAKEATQNLQAAYVRGLRQDDIDSLDRLASGYAVSKNYAELAKTYEKLITLEPGNVQYHASLASTYKELGLLEKAREQALKVLQLNPAAKDEVNSFLQTLR